MTEIVGKVLRKPRPLNTVREFLVPSQASAASSVASPTANRAGGQSGAASKLSWPPAAAIALLSKNVGKDELAGRDTGQRRLQCGQRLKQKYRSEATSCCV